MPLPLASLLLAAALQEAPAPPAAAAPASVELGLSQLKRGRYQSARAELEKAVAADPQNAAAHFYLGYALYKLGEPSLRLVPEKQQAAEHFARCFAIDPAFKPALGAP